jgi:hypothetical protein
MDSPEQSALAQLFGPSHDREQIPAAQLTSPQLSSPEHVMAMSSPLSETSAEQLSRPLHTTVALWAPSSTSVAHDACPEHCTVTTGAPPSSVPQLPSPSQETSHCNASQ